MLIFKINSLFHKEKPNKQEFKNLIENIESDGLFKSKARRFIYENVRLGKFTIERTKTITGSIVYQIIKIEEFLDGFLVRRRGYEICLLNKSISEIYLKTNENILDGWIRKEKIYDSKKID